jgi:hypothetical protein
VSCADYGLVRARRRALFRDGPLQVADAAADANSFSDMEFRPRVSRWDTATGDLIQD